jgi:hypothetical protein
MGQTRRLRAWPLTLQAKAKPRQGECRGFSDWRLVGDIANPTVSIHIANRYTTLTVGAAGSEMLSR